MRYKVLAYTGLAWLQDLGTYDRFDEAQESLNNYLDKQLESLEEDEKESYQEIFWFSSYIEEVMKWEKTQK